MCAITNRGIEETKEGRCQLHDAFQLVPCSNSPPFFFWRNCYELGTFVSAHRKRNSSEKRKRPKLDDSPLSKKRSTQKIFGKRKPGGECECTFVSTSGVDSTRTWQAQQAKEKRPASDKAEEEFHTVNSACGKVWCC